MRCCFSSFKSKNTFLLTQIKGKYITLFLDYLLQWIATTPFTGTDSFIGTYLKTLMSITTATTTATTITLMSAATDTSTTRVTTSSSTATTNDMLGS